MDKLLISSLVYALSMAPVWASDSDYYTRAEKLQYKQYMREYKHFSRRIDNLYRLRETYTAKLELTTNPQHRRIYLKKLHDVMSQETLLEIERNEVEMLLEEF